MSKSYVCIAGDISERGLASFLCLLRIMNTLITGA